MGRPSTFESEVVRFNQRLQAGLGEVRRFERISELKLDLVTNFEGLGFYRKLKNIDAISRERALQSYRAASELPPAETAHALRDFLSVIGTDGSLEVNLSEHITLAGAVTENGTRRLFSRAQELEHISSTGLSSVIIITLMCGLLNAVRGSEPVFVPWVTDEVGKYDSRNFAALLKLLQDNRIDVVFASPDLAMSQLGLFSQRYVFLDHGEVRHYKPRMRLVQQTSASA